MNTEKAKSLLKGRELVFALGQGAANRYDPALWRDFVALAAESGATHVEVGWLPFRYNTWFLPDNTDPYASWCNIGLGLFRAFPPAALQEWVPLDEARTVQGIIDAQVAELRRHGLKGVMNGCEPLWLPEGVYRAHPHWRGAQCELGRIARRPYFAANIDEPEVLELYRLAMQELATRFPEVDQVAFMANDSGSGLSWAPCIYPGMNGPSKCRGRDPGERVARWLEAMQDGAAAAGVKMRVHAWSSGLPAAWVASTRAKLRSGLFMNWANNLGESYEVAGAGLGGGLWGVAYPALGISEPAAFISGLQNVYHNPKGDPGRCNISFAADRLPLARTLIETVIDNPGPGALNATRLLLSSAEKLTGTPALAERLLEVWDNVRLAQHAVRQIQQKGFSIALPWVCVTMRWLIRPLVPRPLDLTEAEAAGWRKFLFSVNSDAENADFGNVLGKIVFKGESVAWMTRWILQEGINRLKGSQATVKELAAQAAPELRPGLECYAAQLGAFACLAATVKHTVMYQCALDTAAQPQYGPNMMDYDDNILYDQRALVLRKIAREELDNMSELLDLLRAHPGALLEHARKPEEESVFMLGTDVAAAVERKMNVMLDHWQDYEQLYPSTKMRDFEPAPTGNLVGPGAGGVATRGCSPFTPS